MNESMIVLDSVDFDWTERDCCILRGWLYSGQDVDFESQVRLEYEEVFCTMTRIQRPDVIDTRKDLVFNRSDVGYEIRIPNLSKYFDEEGTLRVRLYNNQESLSVCQMKMSELKLKYKQSSLRYYMEKVQYRANQICLQGWIVNFQGNLELGLLDGESDVTKTAKIVFTRRNDLGEIFHVDSSLGQGFSVELPKSVMKSKELVLVLKNDVAEWKENISLKKLDREHTRIGRFVDLMKSERRGSCRKYLKEDGPGGLLRFLLQETEPYQDDYSVYAKKKRVTSKELKIQKKVKFKENYKFSIVVPLYHTPLTYLKEMIDSVVRQSYENWELCLADGSNDSVVGDYIKKHYGKEARIRYQSLKENTGISGNTNAALEMARGEYIIFADHDDRLEFDALYHVAKELETYPETELIYTDEELMDQEGNSIYPHFKPDFNLDYLRCINYICHLVIVKKNLLEKVGYLRKEFDGAQDFDFLLRCAENTDKIRHIPKVLYQWRSHDGSTAGNQDSKNYAVEAGIRALEEHYNRLGILAEVEFTGIFILYRTRFLVKGEPKVSILIPNKDHIDDLKKCVDSIELKSTWKNYEIIIIENNSEEQETFAYYDELEQMYDHVKVIRYEGKFNYSAINNTGANHASGEYLLLLNNDTEVITSDWLEQMLGICQRDDVGVVGAKLYYPDDTVQHAGIVIGMGGFAGHIQTGYSKHFVGYMGRLISAQAVSAVTGACLMVKKSIYDELHGLDEEFAVALNDVDFCLRVKERGWQIIYQPGAELYHCESKSRGLETTPEKKARFGREIERFQKRHHEILEKGDPYYNRNLTLEKGDCSVRTEWETVKGRM